MSVLEVGARSRTVGAVRRALARRLREARGDDNSALDARMILAHAMEREPADLPLLDDRALEDDTIACAEAMIQRRIGGEPVARIIGEKEFWSLRFRLSRGTLVPRPDSETLVAAVLASLEAAGERDRAFRILDLGTGSGCLLLALLSELPHATGIGVDLDRDAVATARDNADRLGLGERAHFVAGNWAEGITGRFDAIVSNPPYVEDGALPELAVEVRRHDPVLALLGGDDGLDAYREIVPQLPRLMASGAVAALEFGPNQAAAIAMLSEQAGMSAVVERDIAGRERVALLRINPVDAAAGQKSLGKSGWTH